jgi:hypothetical protein
VIGLIGAAGGTRGLQAINMMFHRPSTSVVAVWYVVPAAAWVFDTDGRIRERTVALWVKTFGEEVVCAAGKSASDDLHHRRTECARAAGRVAAVMWPGPRESACDGGPCPGSGGLTRT